MQQLAQSPSSTAPFLQGGGEMGAHLRERDWSSSVLGPPSKWPQSLKTAVRIMLTSRQPMFVWWGDELINLYNDAYIAILGGKHPQAIGQPASQVWREIWDQVGPRVETAMCQNEGTYDEALLLIMERNGYAEETYYTFSYSPVTDEGGVASGILCANTDDTQRIVGDRQLALLRELASRTADARTFGEACRLSTRCLESDPCDLPFAAMYLVDSQNRRVVLSGTAGIDRGHPAIPEIISFDDDTLWPLTEAMSTRRACVVFDLPEIPGGFPCGGWKRPPRQAVAVPIAPWGADGKQCLLFGGLNPFRLFDDKYRGFIDLMANQICASLAHAHAYEEARQRAESLAELDRAKTAFFSNVSHEFRTPLTLLLGPIEELLSRADDAELSDERPLLTVMHRNGRRLLKLVNTLLEFSRIEAGRVQASYEPTDLAALTTDLTSAFRAAVEKAGMTLTVDCPPLAEPVFVDRDMWEKIVLNLMSNAFKHTFAGAIQVRLRTEINSAVLSIEDSGIGIPAAELPRIFNRFHRVEGAQGRTQEGTGIGLALVHELAKLHGGTVRAESVLGTGSTFFVTLPLGSQHLPHDQVSKAPSSRSATGDTTPYANEVRHWLPAMRDSDEVPAAAGESDLLLRTRRDIQQRPRVLLADDNADMRDYVQRLLVTDYEVTAVADGRQALQCILTQLPDLVLTDIMMPQMNGVELLRALRGDPTTASLPVIMLSARAGEDARIDGLESGADDYLVKPFSAKELLARVGGTLALSKARREAVIRETELRAETTDILESMTEGFLACDADWRITYLNAEAERATGTRRSELIGQSLWDAFPNALGTVFETEYRRAMQDRVATRAEAIYEPLQRWYEASVYPTKAGGVASYIRDITASKRAKEAIRESEQRFTRFMQHLPGLAWIKDLSGRYVFANAAATKAFQKSWEELQFKTDRDVFPPETAAQFHDNDQQALEGEAGLQTIETLNDAEGALRHSIVAKFPIPGPDNKPALIGGIAIDITERKQAEEALRESEARFRNLADHAPVLIWVSDPQACEFVNREYLQFVGRPLEDVLGDKWRQFIHPDDVERYVSEYEAAAGQRQPFAIECRMRRADGEYRWVRSSVVPRFTPEGSFLGYVGCSIDITDIRNSERALRENDRRKDEFLAMLAHELRNPLAPIRSGLDVLALTGADPTLIEPMQQQLEHLVRLVDDLLDVSRIIRGKVMLRTEPVALATLMSRALETVQPLVQAAHQQLSVSLPSNPVWLNADPVRLVQIMSNLLNNASKFTPAGGRVSLSADRDEEYVRIRVRDSGVGIEAELLPQIFDLFTQSKQAIDRTQGGLGIGLTVVRSLTEMHGGTIAAESDGPNRGCVFTLRLPTIPPPQPAGEPRTQSPTIRACRILVVDDNTSAAKMLGLLLNQLGHHDVRIVHDGLAALAAAEECPPDLLLLDIGLPQMDGYQVAIQLRQQEALRNTLLVALTGYGAEEDRRKSLNAGFDEHLVKPPSLEQLRQLFQHPKLQSCS